MSTRYTVSVIRHGTLPDGTVTVEHIAVFNRAPAWEVAPALKALAKKIHESPPPVVLKSQEPMI